DDPVVLWQIDRRQLRSVRSPELRTLDQEVRHVGAQLPRGRVQPVVRQGLGAQCIREAEGRRSVGATTTESGGDRDALRDLGVEPAAVRDELERAADERVAVD